MWSASLMFPCHTENRTHLPFIQGMKARDEDLTKRFASSKSWNWKAGAQVQPMRKKWFSTSLGGALSIVSSGEMLMFFVVKDPNQTTHLGALCTAVADCQADWVQGKLVWPAHLCHSIPLSERKYQWWWKKMLQKKRVITVGRRAARLKIV